MFRNLVRVYTLFTPQERRHGLILAAMILIGACFEVLGVGTIFPVVMVLSEPARISDAPLIGHIYRAFGQPPSGRFVAGVLLGLVLVYVLKNIYLAALAYWQGRFAYNKQAALSQRLFAHYLRLPYSFHLQRNSAELTRNLTGQVDHLVGTVVLPVLMLFAEVVTALALITLLLLTNPLAGTLVMSSFCLATLFFYRSIQGYLARWGERRNYHDGQALLHIQQGLGGVKDTMILGRQDFFLGRYAEHSNARAQYSGLQFFVGALPLLWLETLAVAALLGLVLVLLWQGQNFALVVPTLGLFTAAAFRLMPSVNRILVAMQNLRFSNAVIESLSGEMLGALDDSDSDAQEGTVAALSRIDEVCLDNVHYFYPNTAAPSLRGVSLSIKRGESIGLVGPSGSGKTTLVDIVLGLLEQSEGQVLINGHALAVCRRAWQNQIGYVPQSIYLTDDSLRNNIAFGLADDAIDEKRVWQVLEIAQLVDYVRTLPDGLATPVGERGVRLSGGQRQRIGIARALYHDPEVLVFDEATSALDNETEAAVVAAIERLHGQKTMIIIAHRLTTVAGCDRVVRLVNGRIE